MTLLTPRVIFSYVLLQVVSRSACSRFKIPTVDAGVELAGSWGSAVSDFQKSENFIDCPCIFGEYHYHICSFNLNNFRWDRLRRQTKDHFHEGSISIRTPLTQEFLSVTSSDRSPSPQGFYLHKETIYEEILFITTPTITGSPNNSH